MAGLLAAVLGTGQTKYVAKRQDVSMNGLVREAIDKALADSGATINPVARANNTAISNTWRCR